MILFSIQITGGGSASPSKVSIPGYVSPNDPGLTVDIYDPVPTAYTVRCHHTEYMHVINTCFLIGSWTRCLLWIMELWKTPT